MMQKEMKYWYLRNVELFANLSKDQVNDLAEHARFFRMKKGQVIQFSNDDVERLYFLMNGKIKVSESDGLGNELIKCIVLNGDLFGECIEDNPLSNSRQFAEILSSEVIICSFSRDSFEELMKKYPMLALCYSRKMNEKLRQLESRYSSLVFKDVKSRLKSFLLDWAQREGTLGQEGWVIKNYLTHSEIASLISSSRQTVTTLINEMKERGELQYSRSMIVISNSNQIAA